MKKIIFTLAIATLMIASGSMLTSCRSSEKKVEDAQNAVQEAENDVKEANLKLDKAIKDSIKLFKIKNDEKIIAHNKSIAEFKARIAKDKKENKASYEKELARIEQKNTDLKKKLDEYNAQSKNNWETFKTEFNKDMDDISKAIVALTTK